MRLLRLRFFFDVTIARYRISFITKKHQIMFFSTHFFNKANNIVIYATGSNEFVEMFQRRDRFDFGGGGHSIRNGPSGVGSRSTCSFRFGGILGRTRKTIPSSRLYRALERESRIVDSGSQGGRVIGVAVHGIERLSASTCYDWRGDKFVHGSDEIIRVVLVEGCGAEFSLVAGICFRTATKTSVDFAENFWSRVERLPDTHVSGSFPDSVDDVFRIL
jgi:hypothetical protein